MKKFYYLPLALAALAFSACSSDDGVTADEGTDVQRVLAEGGYMKVAINLPSTAATKATDNSADFSDGIQDEYEVVNSTLMLFSGDDEASAKFIGAYNMGTGYTMYEDTPNQITSIIKIDSSKDKVSGSNLYAFVVLNKNSVVRESNGTWAVNNTNLTTETTFKTMAQSIINGSAATFGTSDISTNGILMTNAPLSLSKGSASATSSYMTLAPVDASKVFTTQAQAEAKPAAEIFVERAVAKVTMHKATSMTLSDATGTGLTASTSNWALDITNNYSFFVHQLYGTSIPQSSSATAVTVADWTTYGSTHQTSTSYRFVGSVPVKNGSYYRTYWGVDPNYAGNKTSQFTSIEAASVTGSFIEDYSGTDNTAKESNGAQYCMENTFNVANQNQDQTTRAIVKVQLTGGVTYSGGAYAKNETANVDLYYVPAQGTKAGEVTYYTYTEDGLKQLVKDLTSTTAEVTINKNNPKAVTVTIADNESATTLVNQKLSTVTYYQGGVCYYPIRIKHFGDSETPWDSTYDGISSAKIYGFDNGGTETEAALKDYLGRYGVLRNNWYDITVNSIAKPGSPDIPTPEDTPDDEISNYISFSINILSWAKRSQSANL